MAKAAEKDDSSSTGGGSSRMLFNSLEKLDQDQKRRRRPAIVLGSLICLFLSAGAALSLAVILMINPIEVLGACITRDIMLFAACMSFLYIALHIRGATKACLRPYTGATHLCGDYLHASAVLVARVTTVVWVATLVAATVMIFKSLALPGFAASVPFLELVICVGAM